MGVTRATSTRLFINPLHEEKRWDEYRSRHVLPHAAKLSQVKTALPPTLDKTRRFGAFAPLERKPAPLVCPVLDKAYRFRAGLSCRARSCYADPPPCPPPADVTAEVNADFV